MAALMSCSPDCIKLLQPDGRLAYMSHNGRCAMEVDDVNALLDQPWSSFWPKEHAETINASVDAARAGKIAHFVADCPTAKGRMCRWDVTVMGVVGADKSVVEIMAVSRETDDPCRPLTIT